MTFFDMRHAFRATSRATACTSVLMVVGACAQPTAATGVRASAIAQVDASDKSSATSGCVPKERAEDLHRRLQAEAGQAFSFRKATPLLVDRWPDPTALVMYTYETQALPTGRVTFEIMSPEWQLRISPLGARVAMTHLDSVEKLGREEDHVITDARLAHLEEAEEVLVEVVGGCRSAAQACKALEPYKSWYDANPVIGRYLTGRLGVAVPCFDPN